MATLGDSGSISETRREGVGQGVGSRNRNSSSNSSSSSSRKNKSTWGRKNKVTVALSAVIQGMSASTAPLGRCLKLWGAYCSSTRGASGSSGRFGLAMVVVVVVVVVVGSD